MARAGIVTADGLARRRKYAIVIAFGFAAVLTPPDLISQIGLGIPIIILYEISIVMARISERKRAKANAEDDDEDEDEAESDDGEEAQVSTGTTVATAQEGVDAQGEAAASYDDGQSSLTRSSDDDGDAPKLSGPSNNDDGEDDFNNAR